jgi:aspartyl-tRNA(Asn)/glutamyl-tRNA(Gln) amidotransferase subunit B
MSAYAAAIGLEVHIQLDTRSKMFCGCSTRFGAPPNTNVCPVCLGYPGAMPAMNETAIRLTVLTGMMIGSDISAHSKFDRKSYFYPDMPKNYQISQYDKPLCVGGRLEIETDAGRKPIRIVRIHLEEDVGKNMHFRETSGVDFNRAGIPLMEVVTAPDLSTPREAYDFLQALKQVVTYAGVSRCNLEEGNLRCDVNCSVRPAGSDVLGTKTEIKNMNTFRGVLHALEYEIARQTGVLAAGGAIEQETRRWDPDQGVTSAMRSKEEAHDYRYFPEPDLMPVVLAEETLAAWRAGLPEAPRARRARLEREYGLPAYDAGVLADNRGVADYFEAAARLSKNPKAVSNWVMTDVLRTLSETDTGIEALRVTPAALARLIELVDEGRINSPTARQVFTVLSETGGDPAAIVEERGLAQVSDDDELARLVARAMQENQGSVADYRKGKKAALQYLVGQVMRASRGKANPGVAARLLAARLDAPGDDGQTGGAQEDGG